MTREQLEEILLQADRTCGELKKLRDMLGEAASRETQLALNEAMRAVIRIDNDLGQHAIDLLRRNAA